MKEFHHMREEFHPYETLKFHHMREEFHSLSNCAMKLCIEAGLKKR